MLAVATGALVASSGYIAAAARPAVQVRAQGAQMFDVRPFDGIWGMEAKKACFAQWDPEKPRDYENFNPFERNDESGMCDTNGCFSGQSRGYRPPNRPDASWEIMAKERAEMDELAKDPKFSIKGKPGNFHLAWQKGLKSPPIYE